MKTKIFTILIFALCLTTKAQMTDPESMDTIYIGMPTFKYAYNDGVTIFTVLGYWSEQQNKGIVYSYLGEMLIETVAFKNYDEFTAFLIPSDKSLISYVVIPLPEKNKLLKK